MITVLSMSPAIDRTIRVWGFAPGGTYRGKANRDVCGGKGINVALALTALFEPCRVIGLMPKEGGEGILDKLRKEGIPHGFIPVPGRVRINLKIQDPVAGEITEINEESGKVPANLLGEAADQAVQAAKESQYLVLTGSLPKDAGSSFYFHVIRRVKAEAPHCRCVLDASGGNLAQGVLAGPWLIKPNREELPMAAQQLTLGREDVIRTGFTFLAHGVRQAVISLGAEGAMAFETGRMWERAAIPVKAKTTVGAGDAMVAGLLHGFRKGLSLREALNHGIAAATARCVKTGDAFMKRTDYDAFLLRIQGEPDGKLGGEEAIASITPSP